MSEIHADNEESPSLASASDIGQLKEALGRLYKRIDEADIAQKEQREKDRQVLNLWAETNLIQTELLGKQTLLIDQLTQELQKNETFWKKFARSSADLMRDLLDWKQQLMGMQPPAKRIEPRLPGAEVTMDDPQPATRLLPSHLMKPRETQELEAMLARILEASEEMPAAMRQARIRHIAQSLEAIQHGKEPRHNITSDIPPLTQKNAVKMVSIAVVAVVVTVIATELFSSRIAGTQVIQNEVNALNTKLTRIEKKLGTNQGK